ncbi:cytochrome P450 [Mycena floridula]|nr:cytochrome P450 [Mycena floridula]
MSLTALSTVSFLVVLAYLIFHYGLRKEITDDRGNTIPPGPLLRYAFLRRYPERVLHRWANQYGPLFSVWMGDQLFVVISDAKIARDLVVTNGAVFSGRKNYFMKNQTILRGRAITASPYGDTWRFHRKIAMQFLNPHAVQDLDRVLDYEGHILIRSLNAEALNGPGNPAHFCGRYALNNMLAISFGKRTSSVYDPLVERALAVTMEFMDLTGPWSNAIDFIKPLQWLPSKMKSRGRKLNSDIIEVYGAMINRVRARLQAGEEVPNCLAKTVLELEAQGQLDWEDCCMLTAVFTLGGVHSTAGIIQWFMALIPSHPEIQALAHEELDRVIGQDGWPTTTSESQLPYIRAIIKEVERIHAPFWMATPHCSTEDFVYNGMFIPKDTVVILNCYTMHHDEQRYPDSYTFNLDRYLGDQLSCAESAKLPDIMKRDHWTFGGGRRFCPGIVIAERELWLAISRLLWAFRIEAVPGEPISLEEYEGLSGRTPLPYRVRLVQRHTGVDSVLEKNAEL